LCDITGGVADMAKAEAMDKWIKKMQPNTHEVLYGVVLAPNVEGPSAVFKAEDSEASFEVVPSLCLVDWVKCSVGCRPQQVFDAL